MIPNLLAQAPIEENFWKFAPGSPALLGWVLATLVVGFAVIFVLTRLPQNLRRPVVWTATFLAGLYWVLFWIWPRAVNRSDDDIPRNAVEGVSFWLLDANPIVSHITQTLVAFLLGLGIYSLLRIHLGRVLKRQKDAFFSIVLLLSMVTMVFFGYWNWITREKTPIGPELLDDRSNWRLENFGADFLFDGLLQQMEAVMFSMIAFFILSAAYRAFRIRSVESTVLMVSALLVMLSLMGAFTYIWSIPVEAVTQGDPSHFANNFLLTSIAEWIRNYVQIPSLRALDFGIGLGALAIGLRIWLGLEKGGISA